MLWLSHQTLGALLPGGLPVLKGRGLEQEVGGRQPGARSMCEQSVQPGQSRRLCVCVCVCVECVCEGGEESFAIPAPCNHILIIPFRTALRLAPYTQSSTWKLAMKGLSLRCSRLPWEAWDPDQSVFRSICTTTYFTQHLIWSPSWTQKSAAFSREELLVCFSDAHIGELFGKHANQGPLVPQGHVWQPPPWRPDPWKLPSSPLRLTPDLCFHEYLTLIQPQQRPIQLMDSPGGSSLSDWHTLWAHVGARPNNTLQIATQRLTVVYSAVPETWLCSVCPSAIYYCNFLLLW